jgi:uncharacterized RDD family membrane protein YckC
MSESPSSGPPEIGHYYAAGDYAGLLRRFVIIAVDSCVIAAAGGLFLFLQAERQFTETVFYSWIAFTYVYLVLLEASAVGTLGFLLTGVKIVTLKGERPSVLRMTFRLLLWTLGPINACLDLYWLTGDDYKQTLRDKFASTYVIRRNAIPAGSGEIRLNRFLFLGYNFVFYEVRREGQT